jgi:hypothetical protein
LYDFSGWLLRAAALLIEKRGGVHTDEDSIGDLIKSAGYFIAVLLESSIGNLICHLIFRLAAAQVAHLLDC